MSGSIRNGHDHHTIALNLCAAREIEAGAPPPEEYDQSTMAGPAGSPKIEAICVFVEIFLETSKYLH